MVEGPGCTNNGRKASKHVGKLVVGVMGHEASSVASAVRQRRLVNVLTLGKELWLLFSEPHSANDAAALHIAPDEQHPSPATAVRLHFGMSGSLHMDNSSPQFPGARLTLGLVLEGGGSLRSYQSTASVEASVAAVLTKHAEGRLRDVCAEEHVFHQQACVDVMSMQPPTSLLCDVVLDQAVLPGAGNIIKVEGLHRAKLWPMRCMGTLSQEEMHRVVCEVRAYARAWQRAGRAPAKLVYDRTECGTCGGGVLMQKTGGAGHLQRVTFWCGTCQPTCSPYGGGGGGAGAGQAPGDPVGGVGLKRPAGSDPSEALDRVWGRAWMLQGSSEQSQPAVVRPASTCQVSCPVHGCRGVRLKRARKAGANAGRLFFTCQASGCAFFKWADAGFPRCNCILPAAAGHQAGAQAPAALGLGQTMAVPSTQRPVCILRVSKKEGSGGKWFFCCGQREGGAGGRDGGCNFFMWSMQSQLESLGQLLTPLL